MVGSRIKLSLKVTHFSNRLNNLKPSYIITNNHLLYRLKELMKKLGKEHKTKLTFMPLLIKAASQALTEFPMINAHVNADCTAVTYKASHNIGIATDTPHGLMVPNIKNVQVRKQGKTFFITNFAC